ncbi:hypothetical protein K458DRAFT_385332 [Lentithecium fluviatile CBS 122367]|uniref:Lytic polysaccharide monooxygenase n=1 Tax=Lentithecium fluviatile CBS 122367 TaxID=1168545 RepID=A0A6G1JB46_9PLEO|nr:hypothetical protein K458DRAFT_385332 [Lentithecium fluviatile CBS 122367]
MHPYNLLLTTLALASNALSAPSQRSTIHVTITSTTTIIPGAVSAAASPSKPIVTVIVTEYTTVTAGLPSISSLPPHTISSMTGSHPTYSGIPSGCIMVCPSGITFPGSPTLAANTSSSAGDSSVTSKPKLAGPIYPLLTPEPEVKTTISPETSKGTPTEDWTCPHSMTHSIPAEISGSEVDGPTNEPGAEPESSSQPPNPDAKPSEASTNEVSKPLTTDPDDPGPTKDNPPADSSSHKFLLSSTDPQVQPQSAPEGPSPETTDDLGVPDTGKSYVEPRELGGQNELR